jgi:hypothetical protein
VVEKWEVSFFLVVVVLGKVRPGKIDQTEDKTGTRPDDICCLFALSACHNYVSFYILMHGGDEPACFHTGAVM